MHTISYLYPADDEIDAYRIHLRGDTVEVELESRIKLHFPADCLMGALPSRPTPSHPSITFKHSLAITIVPHQLHVPSSSEAMVAELFPAWRTLLYGSLSDPRIVSILDTLGYPGLEPSPEVLLLMLMRRVTRGLPPMTGITFPSSVTPYTLGGFREIANAVGPRLKSLVMPLQVMRDVGGINAAILELDKAFPSLEYLTLRGDIVALDEWTYWKPLAGMRHLRGMIFAGHAGRVTSSELAAIVHGMGSDETVFSGVWEIGMKVKKGRSTFHDTVHEAKR